MVADMLLLNVAEVLLLNAAEELLPNAADLIPPWPNAASFSPYTADWLLPAAAVAGLGLLNARLLWTAGAFGAEPLSEYKEIKSNSSKDYSAGINHNILVL